MFKNIGNFGYQRTKLQAVGFYIVYLIIGVLLGGLSAGILAMFNQDLSNVEASFEFGAQVGARVGLVYCLGMAALIAFKKQLKSPAAIILVLSSGVGALVMGALLGLVPVAILTTFAPQNKQPAPEA